MCVFPAVSRRGRCTRLKMREANSEFETEGYARRATPFIRIAYQCPRSENYVESSDMGSHVTVIKVTCSGFGCYFGFQRRNGFG